MSISYDNSLKIAESKWGNEVLFMGPSQFDKLYKVSGYAVP